MVPKYRPDVDGLRAVAVLSVMFFHLKSSLFTGGFVGVDVFFVISGYLITTIIVREIAEGSFSIANFYERRFRRILPALIVVMAATLVAGSFLLTPGNLIDLGHSAAATAVFCANILFFMQSGYFAGPAELKPLLHTWSLAIEEQYYIFFPLMLMLIARFDAARYFRWLLAIGLASFAMCVMATKFDASAAFYLIPTRAWELFIGSILALHVLPAPGKRYVREPMALCGVAMIAWAVFAYTRDTPFPGVAAALPTLGTALVIQAGVGGRSVVSSVLSLRPIVFIGLISYSLYLWHWPIIVYTRLCSITEPGPLAIALMLLATFAAAILTWAYVETPFRRRRLLPRRRGLIATSFAALLTMFCSGMVLAVEDGLPHRDARFEPSDPEWAHWDGCAKRTSSRFTAADLCAIGAPGRSPSFLVWGDSHARALASGIDRSARSFGANGVIASRLACPPLLEIERPERDSCEQFNEQVLRIVAADTRIRTVILVGRWALSTKGSRYKQESGESIRLVDLLAPTDAASNPVLFERGLERTVAKLRALDRKVVIVRPVPEVGYDVPSYVFSARITGRDLNPIIAPKVQEYRDRTREVDSTFSKLGGLRLASFVDPATLLCNDTICPVTARGMALYRDDDHLSTYGSKVVSPIFDEVFGALTGRHAPDAAAASSIPPGPRSPAGVQLPAGR